MLITQNEIRTNPRSISKVINDQIALFSTDGDRILKRPGRTNLITKEGRRPWYEAKALLDRQSPLQPLEWSDGLALAAEDHCKDQGSSGTKSHRGSSGTQVWNRLRLYGSYTGSVGENIITGEKTGSEYMIEMYVDDGTESREHRKAMSNPVYKMIEIARCKHNSREKFMVVAVYASNFEINEHGKREIQRRKNGLTAFTTTGSPQPIINT